MPVATASADAAGREMTTLASRTKVRAGDDGRLTAQCFECAAELVLAPGADTAAALAALDAAHPAQPHRPRPHVTPKGWVVPLSSFGAWSQ